MGYAIAESCAQLGAEVILVSGPVNIKCFHPSITIIPVTSALEMYESCMKYFSSVDAAILSAAVADFSPLEPYMEKIKRGSEEMIIRLKPTRDIAAELGKIKTEKQVMVGFALETTNELENAKAKLIRKNFDFIVLNSLQDAGAGFGGDTNKITIIDSYNNIDKFELKSKREVADDIVEKLIHYMT